MKFLNRKTNIDFMSQRKIALIFSSIMIIASITSLATRGLNFGLDFTGGTLIEVGYQSAPDTNDVRENLANAGFDSVVVNVSWLAAEIEQAVGDGSRFKLKVVYSHEAEALETAGGIVQALDYLDDRFIVVNGDVFTDYPFAQLLQIETYAHLVMVKNPDFHPQGDYVLDNGLLSNDIEGRHTYAGIACYHRSFFSDLESGKRALAPLLRQAADNWSRGGELYQGKWTDVGTLERWQAVSSHK